MTQRIITLTGDDMTTLRMGLLSLRQGGTERLPREWFTDARMEAAAKLYEQVNHAAEGVAVVVNFEGE